MSFEYCSNYDLNLYLENVVKNFSLKIKLLICIFITCIIDQMMIFRSPLLRTLTLLNARTFSGASLEKGLHDPSKHITMNHYPHFHYIDYWPIGQYPPTYTIGSVAPATYQPKVEKILIETLNAKYNTNFELRQVLDTDFNRLFSETLKDAKGKQAFLAELSNKLSSGIIVRESRWTWIKEQQYRSGFTLTQLREAEISNFREFLLAYNIVIEKSVQISHFGLSGKIEYEPTAQEKHYNEQLNNQVVGIKDLQDEGRIENTSFINRAMKWIHSH